MVLVMMMGVGGVWGQNESKPVGNDYSGTYYIANNNQDNYIGYDNANNFYLCAAEEYYDNGTVIPFRFVEGEKEQYMIYTYDMSDKNAFKNFQSRMKALKYSTEGLTKIEMKDLLGMNFEKEKFFLINGEYYK